MANKDTAVKLLKLAKELVATDNDKAYNMIKGSKFISNEIAKKAKAVEEAFEQANKDITGLDKVGSGHIEAPKYLTTINDKISALKDFLDRVQHEINNAL
jgi:hypothetical protein